MKLSKFLDKIEEAKELCLREKLGWGNTMVMVLVAPSANDAKVYLDKLGTVWIIGSDIVEDDEFTDE